MLTSLNPLKEGPSHDQCLHEMTSLPVPTRKNCFLTAPSDISSTEANLQRDIANILNRYGKILLHLLSGFFAQALKEHCICPQIHKVPHQHQSFHFQPQVTWKINMISLLPSSPFHFHYNTLTTTALCVDAWTTCQAHRHTYISQ